MPQKTTFRIDLGELDHYFEAYAGAQGLTVSQALRVLIERLISEAPVGLKASGSKRKFRALSLDSSQHQAAQALAQEHQLTLGRTVRLLALSKLMNGAATPAGSPVKPLPSLGGFLPIAGAPESTAERIEFKATRSEVQALTLKANHGGYRSVQELVIAVVRAFLTRAPVVEPDTVAAIGRTNLSLLRIGATLNQMARSLNAGGAMSPEDSQALRETTQLIEAHTREIADALSMARGRWVLVEKAEKAEERGGPDVKEH